MKKKNEEKIISTNTIYEMQSQKQNELEVQQDETLLSKKINVTGLYDPEENGLTIDMWSNSNGEQILNLFKQN